MIATQLLSHTAGQTDSDLAPTVRMIFGAPTDSMEEVAARARRLLPNHRTIVWEGDAATFRFLYVGGDAEEVLGYPASQWLDEPTFWADTVVHPEDRDEAIAFCALATGKCEDHDFVYRAQASDGRMVQLHDIVTVLRGSRGVAERLRGVMLDVTEQ